jgi:trehalose 6-phosphate phosphatase
MDETAESESGGNAEARSPRESIPSPGSIDLSRTALLLDVDGTLLDIAPTPAGVVVSPNLRSSLSDLLAGARGAVALVSGRTVASLDRLFRPLVMPAIGGHGAEMRPTPGQGVTKHAEAISEKLRRRIHDLGDADAGLLIEDKLHSVAVHYRLADLTETFLKNEIVKILAAEADGQFEIVLGKTVIEIKPVSFNKGSAVSELMTNPPFAGRTPLFIGDDTTDEAVFRILPSIGGRGYSVGRIMKGARATFASPQEVRAWLRRLASHGGKTT